MASYHGRNRSTVYQMGNRLGRGGEGEVYDIVGSPDLVAKVYFDSKFTPTPLKPDPRKLQREKIETMLDQPVNPYINGVLTVAWPQDILVDNNGKFVGFTMPRVNSTKKIFAASREREREQLYPKYSWKTSILIAYNLALAVNNIHMSNAVVGDMNPNNIMINGKGHVTLIDTDSFNIKNRRTGKVYKCSVGVSEVLPPELQGKDLSRANSVFSEKTDSFSLSIHIFNLLMNNCHPFGCTGMNTLQSSTSTNQAVRNIVQGICPYVRTGCGNTSPDAPDYMMLPPEIRSLFDRVFNYTTKTAVNASTINNRPDSEEWKSALYRLYSSNMKTCTKASPKIHVYPEGYSKCPWCEINKRRISKPSSTSTPISTGTKGPTGQLTVVGGSIGGGTGTPPRDKKKRRTIVIGSIAAVMFLIFAINNLGDMLAQSAPGADTSTETFKEEAENQRTIKELSVEKEEPEIYQGHFVEETEIVDGWEYIDISTDTYSVDVDVKGVYGVTASGLHNDSEMYVEMFDETGSKVDTGMGYQTISNDWGFAFSADEVGEPEVSVGESCKINLKGSAETPYKVSIWKPKEIVELTDINDCDYRIHDSMQFPSQENGYSLVPDSDGVIKLTLDDLIESSYLELSVYAQNDVDKHYWEEIDRQSFSEGSVDEMSVELQGGQEYIVYVSNTTDNGVYPYTLSVME